MPAVWTIENMGVTKTVAAWGIDDLQCERASWALETLSLIAQGKYLDAALVFPVASTVIVRRQDDPKLPPVIWFQGTVRRLQYSGSNPAVSQQYAVVGPWWWLQERTFNQVYKIVNGWKDNNNISLGYNYITEYLPRVFLGQKVDEFGQPMGFLTTAEQLVEILNWVLKPFVDNGVTPPFQIGSVVLGTYGLALCAPIDEVKNITCAEAARKMFRWSPDAVAWFDHSTSPPTFNASPRSALPELLLDSASLVQYSVTPEYERQRTFVRLQYEITSELGGTPFLNTTTDFWPDPLPTDAENAFHGIEQVIDLRGPTISYLTATLEVQGIDTANASWWLSNLPHYQAAMTSGKITTFTVDQATVKILPTKQGETLKNLPNQLLPSGGQICKWMGKQVQRQKATAQVGIAFNDGSSLVKTIAIAMTATDATTGNYSQQNVQSWGDPQPQGLARQLYESTSFLHYRGSLTFEQSALGFVGGLGNVISLSGGNEDLRTMRAIVQRVSEKAISGSTRLDFGWPEHLMAGDYIDLLRVARSRQMTVGSNSRSGGSSVGTQNVDVGLSQAEQNSGTAENTGSVGKWTPVCWGGVYYKALVTRGSLVPSTAAEAAALIAAG